MVPLPRRSTSRPASISAVSVMAVAGAVRFWNFCVPSPSSVKPNEPPARVTSTLLMAAPELTPRVPWLTVTEVSAEFAPESLSRPSPALIRPAALVRLLEISTPFVAELFWVRTYSLVPVVIPEPNPVIWIGRLPVVLVKRMAPLAMARLSPAPLPERTR